MAEQQIPQEDLPALNQDTQIPEQPLTPGPEPKKKVTPAPALKVEQTGFGVIPGLPTTKQTKQELPKEKEWKPAKVADLSSFESVAKNYAVFEKSEKAGYTTPSVGIGGVPQMATGQNVFPSVEEGERWLQGVRSNKTQAGIAKNAELKKLSGVAEKITDDIFGSINDIVKQGGRVQKYLIKNVSGLDEIDPAKLMADVRKAVTANGGGDYAFENIYSQVKQRSNFALAAYEKRTEINKINPDVITPEQQKKFYLDNLNKYNKKIKSQVDVQDKLLSDGVQKIKDKYFIESEDIGYDMDFYWKTAFKEAEQSLEGITGIYQPALQKSFEDRAKKIFDEKYAQYVMPRLDDMNNRMVAEVKQLMSNTNRAVNAIYKENEVAYKAEVEAYSKKVEGKNKVAIDEWSNKFSSIVDNRLKERDAQAKGYAQSMINMSAMPGVLGAAVTGKILGDTWDAAWGSLKNKTALVLNSIGFDANFIDEMRQTGKSDEVRYNMEKTDLGENWFKPGYLAQSITQSAPTMLSGMLVTALTRNPYIGGIFSFATESIENSGGVMERVLENTGDLDAARKAGAESFIKNVPTVLSDIMVNRMFAPIKFAKGSTLGKAKDFALGVASNSAEEVWQTATELSTGVDAKLGFTQALTSRDALNAGIEGGLVAGALGGANIALRGGFSALFDKKNVPSIRTQAIAATIIQNGQNAAIAGTQLNAIVSEADDQTLALGLNEVADIAKKVEDAKQLGLNPQQTQIFAAKSAELDDLKVKSEAVSDPSIKKAMEAQIAAKQKEISGIINGETPIATIELQPGLSFTSTIDGIRAVAAVPEVAEEIAAGNVNIITEDAGLNNDVNTLRTTAQTIAAQDAAMTPEAVDAAIQSENNNIALLQGRIEQAKQQNQPTAEFETQLQAAQNNLNLLNQQKQQYATQVSEGAQQEVAQPSNLVQREGTQEGQPQAREGEGRIGETAQPTADNRNRDFGSQAQEVADIERRRQEEFDQYSNEIIVKTELYEDGEGRKYLVHTLKNGKKRLDTANEDGKRTSTIDTYESSVPVEKYIIDAKKISDIEIQPSKRENRINAKYDAELAALKSRPVTPTQAAPEMAATPTAPVAPTEAAPTVAPINEVLTLDTKDATNLEKVFNFLDNIDKKIGDRIYGGANESLLAIPLSTVQIIVKAIKALVKGGMTLQDAIKKAAADNNVSEKQVIGALNKAEVSSRVYASPQIRGVIEIAKEEATNLNKTEKSSIKAYQKVFSTVQKAIQNIYDTGAVPDMASPIVMAEVTKGIARDAVNAAYPSARKISAQEIEQVSMSTRNYISSLMSMQAKGIKQTFDKAKAVRKGITDAFRALNKQYGRSVQLTIADFNKLLKEVEDAVFNKPLGQETIDDAASRVTSIIEGAYQRQIDAEVSAFENEIRPQVRDLVNRILEAETRKYGSVDAATYSAFGKITDYINANKKEFGVKENEADNVVLEELDRASTTLKKQEKAAVSEAAINKIFATPQGRALVGFAESKANEIQEENKKKKIGKTTSTEAYKSILSDLFKQINAMYARGNYPSGIPSITMVKAAYGIARDSVNAVFPQKQKISPQEAEMVNMSMRDYVKNLTSSQINAVKGVKNRAKAIKGAVESVINTLKENFGTDFKMSSATLKQLNNQLLNAVFSKVVDTTAIDDIITKVSPIVEFAIRKSLLSNTDTLLDKVRSNYDNGRYSGASRMIVRESLYDADAGKWLNSQATLEDISMFNQYLKELTGRAVNTTNLNAAIDLANTFVPAPAQATTTEKDSLNSKITNLVKKASNNQIDFTDLSDLINLEKALANIEQRQGELTGLTQQEQNELKKNYDDLINALPKPIDELLADAKQQIDSAVNGKVGELNTAIETSQEFRNSIENPFLYQGVLEFAKEMTPEFINSLSPKEKMLLASNIDEILKGNPNSVTFEFSAKAGRLAQSKINYNLGKTISSKRSIINENGITGFFNKVRRAFMDIDFNRASAERMAGSFDLFRFHMMDVELNTGTDSFGMGAIERDIFTPLARAIDSAFNKFTESLGVMQEAMKLLNDKSNRVAIKKGLGDLNRELGVGFFGGKAKLMHIKNLLGYGNTFYMEIATRMATMVSTQIDHISNLEEGEVAVDVPLLRNILEVKPEDYDGRTMKDQYQGNPTSITDMTDDANMFDHIAYGILTKGGINKLSDLTKDQLLNLLTDTQKQAVAKWREHINNTRYIVEAAMIRKGSVTAFLNDYFPRRVLFNRDVEVKDIDEYIKGTGANIGVDAGQLKQRKGEVGRLDFNGNSVLYNNLKDIYLVHEVKPFLDKVKGLTDAVDNLRKEKDLQSATYAEAINIAVNNRIKNSLESNERIANNNYSAWYKFVSKVGSAASRVILISQLRQALSDFTSNIAKLSFALGFANKKMKNQVLQVISPSKSKYTTDKGTFVWDDYIKIASNTGSSVHRIMSIYADNFLYEFSKPKEQLQREQRVASWQDMAVKKHAWMSKFEESFNKLTGEYLDHEAFSDERGAYRAMYFDAVQRASDAADSFVDRQYGLASIARQPVRMQIAAPFVGRFSRNVFGKSPTIAKNNPASVVLGFLSGYPGVQMQLFSRYIRSALSMDKQISVKQRAEDITRALTEVVVPSVMYNTVRATQAVIFTTTAVAVMAAGDDKEDRERLYKEMEKMPFWERWFTKIRLSTGEKQDMLANAAINGMLSSVVDPTVNAIMRPTIGLFVFKWWKENIIEEMAQKGKTKEEVDKAKQYIKDVENVWFETYNIRPIELFGTKEYKESIKRYYKAGTESEGIEDLIKSTGGFGVMYNEASRLMDLKKLIEATDENEGLSENEVYVATGLKLGGLFFSNVILGGKYGAALSMLSGDMNKFANMLISDQKSIQTGFEIEKKKQERSGGGEGGLGTGGGLQGGAGLGGGGLSNIGL